MDEVSQLANMLYANLLATSPKKTRNMASNITMEELSDRYIITISRGVPYARNVNYNWGNRSERSKSKYSNKGLHKERDNYKWVERTIEHTFASMYGKGSVSNEL